MSYFPGHRFEAHPTDVAYCGVPTAAVDGICARPADHPIHAGRPDVEDLARQLAGHQWRTEPESLGPRSEHRRHQLNSDCAICRGDVHAIAAAALAILAARAPMQPDNPDKESATMPTGGSVSQRIRALIFNGVTAASSSAPDERDWMRLSERERIAEAVYAELRAGNIEFRLGGLALLAEAVELAEAREIGPNPAV